MRLPRLDAPSFDVDHHISTGDLKVLHDLLLIRHGKDPQPAKRARLEIEARLTAAFDHLAKHYKGTKEAALKQLMRLQETVLDFYNGALATAGQAVDVAGLEKLLRDIDVELKKLGRNVVEVAESAPKLDAASMPPRRPIERPIPPGGISIEERIAQGGKPEADVLADPQRYYYDPTGPRPQYKRRPEPEPDFSSGDLTAPVGPAPERPVPPGGLTVEDAVRDGYKARPEVLADPKRYYFNPESKRFTRRPEPEPDFGDVSQRTIPCFPAGTLVRVADGWLAIEHVKPGDIILSADESHGPAEEQAVSAVHRGRTSRLARVGIGVEVISATPAHRFLVSRGGWLEASALRAGDRLETASNAVVEVSSVRTDVVAETGTYNLEVERHHTYFVGRSSVIVHNEGDARIWKIYIGYAADGSIYVGRAKTDILDRESAHRQDARREPLKYGFKEGIRLEQVQGMDGLTYDEALWHERRVFDHYKNTYGDLVKNIEDPPTSNRKMFELRERHCRRGA